MSPEIPPAPPEADVIRLAREAAGMTAQDASEASKSKGGRGVSPAYWRDVERGHGGRRGQQVPVRASARVLAEMARVVGAEPKQIAKAGRQDAARVLEEMKRREQSASGDQSALDALRQMPGIDKGIPTALAQLEGNITFTDPIERGIAAQLFPVDVKALLIAGYRLRIGQERGTSTGLAAGASSQAVPRITAGLSLPRNVADKN